MTGLPAHLRALEDDLAVAAAARVGQLRRRRHRLQVIVAVLAMLGLAGTGLAASGAIQSWLAAGESGEARFSVDPNAVYEGPAPGTVACDDVSGGQFDCEAGSGARRVYELVSRIEPQPRVTRESALERIETAARTGQLDTAYADQIEADLRAVPDDFFDKLAAFSALSSVAVGSGLDRGDGPVELVPPSGVPRLVECRERAPGGFVCRALAGATGVPVGTPIYSLRPSGDWVEQPSQPAGSRLAQVQDVVEAIWGRPLEPAELRLLHLAITPVSVSRSETTGATTATTSQP